MGEQLEALRAKAAVGSGQRVEHADLLHRLVLKRCIFGVDLSPMGAEVARLSLWLASFVPGLSLAYLGHNVQVGDALLGVAEPEVVNEEDRMGTRPIWADQLERAIAEAAVAASELAESSDRTPAEYAASVAANARLHEGTASVTRLFNAWAAGPLGVPKARAVVGTDPVSVLNGTAVVLGDVKPVAERLRFLHWPLAFPEVFIGERPGFNAVIGNPPWEEVTVEELAFYAQHFPGLRGLDAKSRQDALEEIKQRRPDLADDLRQEQQRVALAKQFLGPAGGYQRTAGDPDTYKFFCQRYRSLLAREGRLGVVLPRTAFLAAGSRGFRAWLFEQTRVERIDFLLNNRLWMFETHPQYTVALLVAAAGQPPADPELEVAGVARSFEEFSAQAVAPGIRLHRSALGASDVVPLLPNQQAEPVLRRMRAHDDFAHGSGRWRCFPTRELHETDDKRLWDGAASGWALWKGESFDQHDPHGNQARWCPPTDAALKKAYKPRPGTESVLAAEVPLGTRRAALRAEVGAVRLAFRDATNRTNSRTVIASLVPPETFLLNSALYLVFIDGGHRARAACCALMNSLPFDWQARRFVESHVSYFILELLTVPSLDDAAYNELVHLGARLSCPDDRFREVANACGVDVGPLDPNERLAKRARVDALVANGYGLQPNDLDVLLADFTFEAIPPGHRDLLRQELETLCG